MLKHYEHSTFIERVILPYYKGLNLNNNKFLIYDTEGKIVTVSDSSLQMLGYSKLQNIVGKTFSDIYLYKKTCPNICTKLNQIRQSVLKEKRSLDYLCITEFTEGKCLHIIKQTPIFCPQGDVIGTVEMLDNSYLWNIQKNEEENVQKLTNHQAKILFLLMIGASQKEIASVFGITRGAIARSVDGISHKLGLFGSSERCLAAKALELGYGYAPLDSLQPSVVLLSILSGNSHVLKHIIKK